jgi:hypothetical protein
MSRAASMCENPYKTVFAPFIDRFRPFSRSSDLENRQANQALDGFPLDGRR